MKIGVRFNILSLVAFQGLGMHSRLWCQRFIHIENLCLSSGGCVVTRPEARKAMFIISLIHRWTLARDIGAD